MDREKKSQHTWDLVLSLVSGIHWGSWNILPTGREGLLYTEHLCSFLATKVKISLQTFWAVD